jgi:hypothetical protein
MVNTCVVCEKIIEDNDDVELYIMGTYKSVKATNIFALHKEIRYKMDTLVHSKCSQKENEFE